MKKMKSALVIGTLIAALGASTVFAATSASTSDYDQNPHKMRDLLQQSIQERNAGNDTAGKINYSYQNKQQKQGPGAGGCYKQGQMHKGFGGQHMGLGGMHKGPGLMREENAKILADLTGRDVESIKEEARTNHKPIREIAKDAGVYDQFMAKHLELAKGHLDKAVADGRMSQDQADKILQNIKEGKHFGPKDGIHKHIMQGPRNGSCQNND
mgnify:CR=1 FL=1